MWDYLLIYRLGCGLPSYLFNISFLLAIARYNLNTIDETAIVTRYFAVISGVAKWHAVIFEGALLINITTI